MLFSRAKTCVCVCVRMLVWLVGWLFVFDARTPPFPESGLKVLTLLNWFKGWRTACYASESLCETNCLVHIEGSVVLFANTVSAQSAELHPPP